MHKSSMERMRRFRDHYLDSRRSEALELLDLGSTDIGGCYRALFDSPSWRYRGVDLAPGPNVDTVLSNPYSWTEVPTSSVDVLISGQVLEHVEFFWITMLEVARVLRPRGLACLIAPSAGPEHRYPVDCWRFYPDGMRALARFSRLDCLEVYTDWGETGDPLSDCWHDSVVVLRKPDRSVIRRLGVGWMQSMQRRVMSWRLIR